MPDKVSVLYWIDKSDKCEVVKVHEDWKEAMAEADRLEEEDTEGRTYYVDEVPMIGKKRFRDAA